MSHRFVVLDDWGDFWSPQPGVEGLRRRGEVVIHTTRANNEDELIRLLQSATVAFINRERTRLTDRVLRGADHLEIVAQTGRLSRNVDADAAPNWVSP